MGVASPIAGRRIALDTVAFIYFIEKHPDYLDVVAPLFAAADDGTREIVTSTLTLLEVLVIPYRAGNLALAERYEALLSRSRGVRMIDIDRTQLRGTAQLRARFPVRTPDAIQLTAALSQRCTTFVTNDRQLPTIPGITIVQLHSLLR